MDPLKNIPVDLEKWKWLLEIGFCVFLLYLLHFVLSKLDKTFRNRLVDRRPALYSRMHSIAYLPLHILGSGILCTYIIDILLVHFHFLTLVPFFSHMRMIFFALCAGWVALRWIRIGFQSFDLKKIGISSATASLLKKLCSFLVTVITALTIFQILGINIIPLLAFGGVGVAAIGFATQDLIANFFGGLMLQFTQPFFVEDEVVIPSQNNFSGIVKEIGWYITVIEDGDKRPVYFPNSCFTKLYFINESRRSMRCVRETVSLRYEDDDKLPVILEQLREKIPQHPEVDRAYDTFISFNKFGQYGLEISVFTLLHKMNYKQFIKVKEEILFLIKETVIKNNAQFAYLVSIRPLA